MEPSVSCTVTLCGFAPFSPVRVTVTETWGDPRAQIFEIRAYDFELGVARSIEVPFANANGAIVTPETCRELGRDLAKTIKAYLEEQT